MSLQLFSLKVKTSRDILRSNMELKVKKFGNFFASISKTLISSIQERSAAIKLFFALKSLLFLHQLTNRNMIVQ